MISEENVYNIGFFNKPHGTRGEMLFTLTEEAYDFDEQEVNFIFCKLDGLLVPFFIETYRYRTDSTLLLKLEGVDSEIQARKFTNTEVFTENLPLPKDNEELTWSFFRHCTTEDVHAGPLGKISRVDTSTMNTLFVIDNEKGELLVPAQEEFIVDIDREKRHVIFQLPQGLLGLNSQGSDQKEDAD